MTGLIAYDFDAAIALEYLGLLRHVHQGENCWIPPLQRATLAQLAPNFPFFNKSGNRHRGFALRRQGKLVGHVLATLNAELRDDSGAVTGALGFLETVADYGAFCELIEPALDWLHDEAGADRVWATMNFDIWHGYRVMTRGFDEPAFLGEPRNTCWQPEFLERYGFRRRKRWFSSTANPSQLLALLAAFEPSHREAVAKGFRFAPLQTGDSVEIAGLHDAVTRLFKGFLGYTPISLREFRELFVGYLRFTRTDLASVLRSPSGELAGFSIAYPDPAELVRRLNGHDDWLHRIGLLLWRPRPRRALHYMIGALPAARAKHKRLGSALAYQTIRLIRERGFEQATFALVAEDSPVYFLSMDQTKRVEREYALYQLDL